MAATKGRRAYLKTQRVVRRTDEEVAEIRPDEYMVMQRLQFRMQIKLAKAWIVQFLSYFFFTAAFPIFMSAQALPEASKVPSSSKLLSRGYHDGEKISYHMKGTNQDRRGTLHYEIQADGTVMKSPAGQYIEEFTWSNLVVNDKPTPLSPASAAFRQPLSLSPGYTLTVPNLSQVDPILIGPITDLLTFYADMTVAVGQGNLAHPGDHFYFKRGTPNSWADGNYALIGEDSIDFDVTLTDINPADKTATVTVKHVPPAQPEVKLPVSWMHTPVADTPNNWVEVTKNFGSKSAADKYLASVGKETFGVVIKVSLINGAIISGTIDNPLDVLERPCTDDTLASCGEAVRYKIHRQIEIHQ